MDYKDFLCKKEITPMQSGFEVNESQMNPKMKDFQKVIVKWALIKGKAAIFEDTGLGKTLQQLEWCQWIVKKENKPVLIVAPLAVSSQTKSEGVKFDYDVNICKEQSDVKPGINITNYERIHKFDPSSFVGVVLDESSILKSFSSKTRSELIERFKFTRYKLCCTATPSPNDYMELGNHSEFLNIMTRSEMLSMFFIHDGSDTSKWRLKGHVVDNVFWKWLSTWAIMIKMPSDIGFDDTGYVLPELKIIKHVIKYEGPKESLFTEQASGLNAQRKVKRDSINDRVEKAAEINNNSDEIFLNWCDLNDESKMLSDLIHDSVEVKGSDSNDHKSTSMLDFADGKIKSIVTKSSIAGFGMNFQICHNMCFVSINNSFESYYQAIRRCWRFGQTKPVNVHIIMDEREIGVFENLIRKERDMSEMSTNMIKHIAELTKTELDGKNKKQDNYKPIIEVSENWTLINGDCVEETKKLDKNSIDYTIFSPPFSSLYTYSNSNRDMGNCVSDEEFEDHILYLAYELYRITKPGRLVSFHCMNIPAMKERDGYIGIKDFRGQLIRIFQASGFIYHSEVCIWKDPLIEATRTKSLGLMHKQIQKDSSRCRQGLPDYVVTMMKPGENENKIAHEKGFEQFIGEDEPIQKGIEYSHNVWRRYASPVWMDINQTRTLNYKLARDKKDERHICPLQLDTIARCIELWSNPGDTVLSPFAGIGSEGYEALRMDRRFIGIELKDSYYNVAVKNLTTIETKPKQLSLFG